MPESLMERHYLWLRLCRAALQFEGEGIDAHLTCGRRIAVNEPLGGTHFQWLPTVLVEKPQGWKASPALQFEGEGIDARLISPRRIAVNERFGGTHFQWLPTVLVEKPQGWKASPALHLFAGENPGATDYGLWYWFAYRS